MLSVLMLAACASAGTPPAPQETPDVGNVNTPPPVEPDPPPAEPNPPIDLSTITVLYNRIDWRDNMEDTSIIRSVDELSDFYEDLKLLNDNELDDDLAWRFTDGNYNDDFFANNFLVMITVSETSGSNRHALSSISEDNNELTINIDREVPDIGTADMAGWLIIIELSNNYTVTKADVIFTDVPVS